MHPIDTQDKLFHDGDGVSELGTILPAWWLNQVQAELQAVLTAAGISPDRHNSAQLLQAIRALMAAGAVPYTGATKHVDLNGKNLANAGELKLGDGRNSNYQQLVMGNYERAAGQGNYGAVFNGKFAGGSARWTTLSTFGEDGQHISSLFADDANAYLRVGSTNHKLATKGTTFAHYGIAGNQELIGGRLTIKGREYPSLALQSTLGNSDLWLESSGSRHYFIRRGRGQTAGGDILYLPDRAGTLATQGTTLAHYGITDAAGRTDVLQAAPPGTVMYFAGATAPAGWLKANGAAVSRTTYAPLFAAIGTRYGTGNGSTTFNLPDLRGEFVRGWDDGRSVDRGRAIGSTQGDAIRNITGEYLYGMDADVNDSIMSQVRGRVPANSALHIGSQKIPDTAANISWSQDARAINFAPLLLDASRAVPTAAENRPRNVALLACIKI
ncbi:MAG: phage tail protein [Eikenella sp.]|nr:phage tail protein [Eikenella sp.]